MFIHIAWPNRREPGRPRAFLNCGVKLGDAVSPRKAITLTVLLSAILAALFVFALHGTRHRAARVSCPSSPARRRRPRTGRRHAGKAVALLGILALAIT